MLVLSRQRDQSVIIGDDVEVTIVDVRGDKVRLGINAPRQISVHRKEVYEAIRRENQAAAQLRPSDLLGTSKPQAPPLTLSPAHRIEPRISIVTLGVRDLPQSISFYHDRLGWPLSSASSPQIAFIRTGGLALALYPRDKLAEDANVSANGQAFGGITLAHAVRNKEDVDGLLAIAQGAGAKILKQAQDTVWGGRSGYFADPDGHLWEVAWIPQFSLTPDGSLALP